MQAKATAFPGNAVDIERGLMAGGYMFDNRQSEAGSSGLAGTSAIDPVKTFG